MTQEGKIFRNLAIGFFTLLAFAILWRLLFDQVTGVTRREREKYRPRPECAEIAMRMECFYKTNKAFPKNAAEVVRLPHVWRDLRAPEELQNNYIFHSAEAERAAAGGKTNVPVVFEKLRSVGRERGGLIGFVFPHKVCGHDEAAYQEHLRGISETTP